MLQSFSWKEKSILIAQIIIKECNFGGSKKKFQKFSKKKYCWSGIWVLWQRCKIIVGLFSLVDILFLGAWKAGDRKKTRKGIYEAFQISMYTLSARNFETKICICMIPES